MNPLTNEDIEQQAAQACWLLSECERLRVALAESEATIKRLYVQMSKHHVRLSEPHVMQAEEDARKLRETFSDSDLPF